MIDLFNQPTFTVHKRENNSESQANLDANREDFRNQCKVVYEALQRGERLTTLTAMLKYGIGDLRARIRDLRKQVTVLDCKINKHGTKEYFITK